AGAGEPLPLAQHREPAGAEVHGVPGQDLHGHGLLVAGGSLLRQQRGLLGLDRARQPVERVEVDGDVPRPAGDGGAGPADAVEDGLGAIVVRHAPSPMCQWRNVWTSAASSACLDAGLPWPGPARGSTRTSTGRSSPQLVAHASAAPNLRAWAGSTRLSCSPVRTSVAG